MRPQHTYRQSRRNEWRKDRELAWTFFRQDNDKLASVSRLRPAFNPSRTYDRKGKR